MPPPRPLQAGVYAPLVTPFHPSTEDLDLSTLKSHVVRLAEAGLVGLVALGSNGEAVHLSTPERSSVIQTVRQSLDEADYGHVPVLAGCSAQSVRGTVELCKSAKEVGADYALVLPPCYYRIAMTDDVIIRFYEGVAQASPIPVLMYNYPGAVAGVDLSSEVMERIAEHRNILGAKFTCASTGKITRVAATTNAISTTDQGSGFLAAGGMADITVQTAMSGGSGVVAGTANVLPRLCIKVWQLCERGQWGEARWLQIVLARADGVLNKGGVPGAKAALEQLCGYGGVARRPLPSVEGEEAERIVEALREAWAIEISLEKGTEKT